MVSLLELANADKLLERPVEWDEDGGWHAARPKLIVAGVNGLFLRLRSPMRLDRAGLMLQTEHQPGNPRTVQPLARLEWRIGHTNPNQGPPELRLYECEGTHIHAFDLNYLVTEGRMRQGNLPIARDVDPDPDSVEAFLAFAEKSLRINGVAGLKLPRVQRLLVG